MRLAYRLFARVFHRTNRNAGGVEVADSRRLIAILKGTIDVENRNGCQLGIDRKFPQSILVRQCEGARGTPRRRR